MLVCYYWLIIFYKCINFIILQLQVGKAVIFNKHFIFKLFKNALIK